ncbi:MAG TPA: EpsI family protein [Gammaproteobacteria bacterium]|nr:EpsI family protein [Gammaproteobacteria bacterium]
MSKPVKSAQQVVFSRQKAILSFVCLFAAWIFFFMPTLASIFEIKKAVWLTFSTYGIVTVSLYFIITRIKIIKTTVFYSSQLGLLCLFLMVIFFILGQITNLNYAEQASVMLMLPALVMTAFGPLLVQNILFPLLYLMFIIPLQDETLGARPLIAGVACLVLIAYLIYQKFFKPEAEAFAYKTPMWISINARWLLPTFIAFSMLMVSPWLGENIRSFYPTKNREIALRAPLGKHGWTGPYSVRNPAWTALYKGASATLEGQYFSETGKNSIYLYTAYFHSDREFSDMLMHSNVIYDPSLWKQVSFGSTNVKLEDNQSANVFSVTLESAGVFRVVWYWYYVAGVSTTDLALAAFLDKIRVIAKHAQGSGVIAISTTYTTDPREATDRLKSFLSAMYNGLDALKRPEIFYTRANQAGT